MFQIIAHRGASGYEPENTLLSFKRAMELHADMIEFDVYACKTGELVVIHDYTVNRTTNGKGYVWDLTFKELRGLDAGKGEKIPTLEEVLDLSGKGFKVNLELKGPDLARPVFKVIEEYVSERQYNYSDFYISSFNHPLLIQFASMLPEGSEIKTCPLICGIPLGLSEFAVRFNAYSINISGDFVNSAMVKDAHKRNMKIFVYTVNDMDEVKRMKSLGVDGIFTNYPDIMKAGF